jgi:hypothetical protein
VRESQERRGDKRYDDATAPHASANPQLRCALKLSAKQLLKQQLL